VGRSHRRIPPISLSRVESIIEQVDLHWVVCGKLKNDHELVVYGNVDSSCLISPKHSMMPPVVPVLKAVS
jgi:hypothetical protein